MPTTLNSAAWDGRVVFHTLPISYAVMEEGDALMVVAKELYGDWMTRHPEAQNLPFMMAATPDITFDFRGDENPLLKDLCEAWGQYKRAKDHKGHVKAIFEWHKNTMIQVFNPWMAAVNEASNPFRRPEQLPESMLTEAEREEAAKPDSPLVEQGENLEKASLTT